MANGRQGEPGGQGGFYHPLFPHQLPLPDPETDRLAQAAIAGIEPGMIVGLGVGRACYRAMRALALRVTRDKLDVDCVCASTHTEELARSMGLPAVSFAEIEEIDALIDGATEVDHDLRMLKGAYGAITRQRLLARVAKLRTYMTLADHYTPRLGSKALLAVTIIPFGIASIRNALRDLGLSGVVRRTMDGKVFETDGGGVLLDMRMPDRPPEEVAEALDRVAGVVDHGIFLDEADRVLIEEPDGAVRTLARQEA